MARGFKVRDSRNKSFFIVDNIYLNGFAKKLGVHATAVYLSLCRHADQLQISFPSQKLIAEENGMSEKTVWTKLQLLGKYNLIKIEKERNSKGKWMNNLYFLIDRTEWKHPLVRVTNGNHPSVNDVIIHPYPLRTNKTNTNNKTNTLYRKIENLTEEDFLEISKRYNFPLAFIKSKYDDMVNWHESTGKQKKNWLATLRNWVKKDGLKIKQNYGEKRAIDASNL